MGFPTTLSAGQITQVRATAQRFKQYLAFTPNTIVWQTQPNENKTNEVYGAFEWTGTLQGDRANVKEGQTVLITTSDSDLQTVVYRGRVRLVPDATDFFIDETSATLSTAQYVTVLEDFDIFERLERRITDGTKYKDWDKTFETLPPIVTGLQSSYVDTSGSGTVNFVFSATADATAHGATISTYSWDVDDGTINSGAGTASIDVDFPGAATNEQRWVVLTVTDSNGVSNYFAFEVYTLDLTTVSNTVMALDTGDIGVTGSIEEGFNLNVRAWDGVDSILDRTRCTLFSVDNYDGTATPITQNVSFVGRLRQESNFTTGDEIYAQLQDTTFVIEGFITQLGHSHAPGLDIVANASPDEWGEVERLTIKRAIVYLLAWHSTYLTVSGVTFDTDSNDYRWGEFVVLEASLLEWVNSVADDQNALLIQAADGQSTVQRDAQITGVAGLTTVHTFTVDDSGDSDVINFQYTEEYIDTHAQAITGASTYNTTTGEATTYVGRAPAQAFGPGWETAPLNQQILKSDLSESDATDEVGTRVANLLAAVNPRPQITAQLMDGFYWIVPSIHQLYAFDIAASENTRGRAYTSSDKWLCTAVDYTYDADLGAYTVNGTFVLVVAGGTSGIKVTLVPDVNDLRLPVLPGISAGLEELDQLINYPVDDPDFDIPGVDAGIVQPGKPVASTTPGCEVLNVSMKTGTIVTTSENTVFGETYTITVEGDGIVQAGSANWVENFDFTVNDGGFAVDIMGESENAGTYNSGTGWQTEYKLISGPLGMRSVGVTRSFVADSTLTSASLTYNLTNSGNWDGTSPTNQLNLRNPNIVLDFRNSNSDSSGSGKTFSWSGSQAISVDQKAGLLVFTGRLFSGADPGGEATLTAADYAGTGTNPFTGASPAGQRGDAFYYGYDAGDGTGGLYNGSEGFQVDSARPSGIPTYQTSHQYTFTITGTGAPFGFRFLDSDYSDNDNSQLTVTCCGPDMAQG